MATESTKTNQSQPQVSVGREAVEAGDGRGHRDESRAKALAVGPLFSTPSFAKTDGIVQKGTGKIKPPITLPYDKMTNADLPMTKPKPQIFKTTRSGTNPLNPVYNLPGPSPVDTVELKFIKDPLSVADIPGARSKWADQAQKKQTASLNRKARQDNPVCRTESEIQKVIFSSVPDKQRPPLWVTPSRNPLQVDDIEKPKRFKMSKRHVDPIQPAYYYYDSQGHPSYLEPIHKSTSSVLHQRLNKVSYGMETADIAGAIIATSTGPIMKTLAARGSRPTNFTDDIENCRPGTLKKGIETKRNLNPLEPDYRLPKAFTEGFFVGCEYRKGDGEVKQRGPPRFNRSESNPIINWSLPVKADPLGHRPIPPLGKHPDNDLFNLNQLQARQERKSKQFCYPIEPRNVLIGTNIQEKLFLPVRAAMNEMEFLERYYAAQKRRQVRIRNPRVSVMKREHFEICNGIADEAEALASTAQQLDRFVVRRA